jgi:hypothetical protein
MMDAGSLHFSDADADAKSAEDNVQELNLLHMRQPGETPCEASSHRSRSV